MRQRSLGLLACLLLLSGGVSSDPTTLLGQASYYHDKLEGRPTASGEPYRKEELTAAHRSYPFGTRLRVTRIQTGQSVEVRVNDRGPHSPNRVIDLSRRAAEALDLLRSGVAEVEIEVLDDRPADNCPSALPTPVSWVGLLGSASGRDCSRRWVRDLP